MELFVLKVAVIAACAFALLFIVRSLSGASEKHASPAQLISDNLGPVSGSGPKTLPRVGSEMLFPLDTRELEAKYGADFAPPKVLNYYFRNIDLVAGPSDPTNFYDEFFIQMENRDDGHQWTTSYWVTTPQGIEHKMAEDGDDALWGNDVLVIKRFDLKTILRAVLESYVDVRDGTDSNEVNTQQNLSDEDIG